MTAQQYTAALRTLGLSHRQAAQLLGISVRLSQSYAQGIVPVRRPVAMLLEMKIAIERLKTEPDEFWEKTP